MFSMITNIYNKKTKRPTLMELMELEYSIDVCCITHGAHTEHL